MDLTRPKRTASWHHPADPRKQPTTQSDSLQKQTDIPLSNSYAPLSQFLNDAEEVHQPKKEKILTLFIKTGLNYVTITEHLNKIVGQNLYGFSTSLSGIKVVCENSNTYRTLIHHLKNSTVPELKDYHTYQLQSEKADRVVIRGLHPTTPIELIQKALTDAGYQVRSVCNVSRKNDVAPFTPARIALPLFFVDLEPSDKNREIRELKRLLYCVVTVEEPRQRRQIVQCTRCQNFNHSKGYCQHTPRCLKCAQPHLTSDCTKERNTPAVCALCSGNHPANYRGCTVYKEVQRRRQPGNPGVRPRPPPQNHPSPSPADFPHLPTSVNTQTNPSPSPAHPTDKSFSQVLQSHPSENQSREESRQENIFRLKNASRNYNVNYPNSNYNVNHSYAHHTDIASQLQNFLTQMYNLINPLITLLTRLVPSFNGP